jgi:NodT family efflux transporter outer membrane factor (OMF) lipoprotein
MMRLFRSKTKRAGRPRSQPFLSGVALRAGVHRGTAERGGMPLDAPRASVAILAALLVAGCTVGPDYVKPSVPQTEAYKETPPEAFSHADVWKPAQPSDQVPAARWWEVFGDPQLNALEDQVTAANQTLKIAESRFRRARAMVSYSRADEFPSLSTAPSLESLHYSNHRPYFSHTHTTGDFVLPLYLTYEVDLWGRVARNVTAAGEEAQATAADLQAANLSLHAELALDYFGLRSTDTQKQLIDDSVKAYEDALRLTEHRAQGGIAPDSDVAEARTQLYTARVQATDIAVQRARYEHAIAVLSGQPPAAFSLPPAPAGLHVPAVPVGVPSELLQRRPDIAAAERRTAAANEGIGIARAAYYPSVVLYAVPGFEGTSITNWLNWPSLFWAAGLSMSQALFDGGRRDASSQAALAAYDATVANYRQTVLSAFQEVEDNLAALRVLELEAQQQHDAVDSARDSLDLSTKRYVGGRDTYLQVITAQTIALTNERYEADILRRRMEASVLLIKAIGGGWTVSELPALEGVKGGDAPTAPD